MNHCLSILKFSKRLNALTFKAFSSESGSFKKAYDKFEGSKVMAQTNIIPEETTFDTLFRTSKFVQLGDPVGKIVVGEIFHVVGDDLYIDFGFKLHCVCKRPRKDPNNYIKGTKVKLKLNDLEVSSRFLGSDKDITLLEADAFLLGLLNPPKKDIKDTKANET